MVLGRESGSGCPANGGIHGALTDTAGSGVYHACSGHTARQGAKSLVFFAW
jgi:hypothetical protein